MKVAVTQDDLDTGLSKSYTHDPVCRAIKRAIQKQYKVDHSFQVLICSQDYAFIDGRMVELPEQASSLIQQIDRRQKPKPITFEIEDLADDFFSSVPPRR